MEPNQAQWARPSKMTAAVTRSICCHSLGRSTHAREGENAISAGRIPEFRSPANPACQWPEVGGYLAGWARVALSSGRDFSLAREAEII